MRIFKKRIAVLLAALMLMSVFSVVAFADEAPVATATADEATPGEATPGEATPTEAEPTETAEPTEATPTETQPVTETTTEATETVTATETATATVTEPAGPKTWILAGNVPAFGGDWDPANTANQLVEGEDGLFTITYTDVPAGEYEFKVTDGTWDESYGNGADNFYVRLTDTSDLKITFNADTKEITVDGKNVTTRKPAVKVTAGYYVVGSAGLCGTDWVNKADPNTLMKLAEDGSYYKDFENIAAGEYNFKVIYCDENNNVTWHPGGMGNDTVVTVETDGSLVRVKFTPVVPPKEEGPDGVEAGEAQVYADPSTAPVIIYVEPTAPTESTEPTTVTEPAPTQPTTAAPKAPALNKTSKSLKAGKTFQIKVKNTTAKATYKSSKTSVAKVSKKGVVTALKKGSATITVKVAGKTLKLKVKVTSSPKVTKVAGKKFNAKKTYTVKKGKTLKVKITGKAKAIKNKFKVTKKGAAKVSGKTTVKIKAKKKGTFKVKITVNKVKTITVKVKVK